MKHLYLLAFALMSMLSVHAQFDTTSTLYDFESLPNGNLNGQDNWQTTSYNTSVDWRIADTLFANVGKGIFFNQVGPSVGASASRAFDTTFPGAVFDNTLSIYVFQFDLVRNYWGVDVGISADLNNDGKTIKTDALEKALIFRSSSLNGESITVPNGTVYTLGNNLSNNAWFSVRITIRPFTGNFGGTVDVEYQPVFAPTWTSLASGLPLYADSLSTTKTNITRWDTFYLHSEGATGKVDELRCTKITPQQTTGLQSISFTDLMIYHSQGHFIIRSDSQILYEHVQIFDSLGKLIESHPGGNCSRIPTSSLNKGNYFVQIVFQDGKKLTRQVSVF